MSFLTTHLVEIRKDTRRSKMAPEHPDRTVYEIQHAPNDPDRPVALTRTTEKNHWGALALDRPHPYMGENEEAYLSLSNQAAVDLVDRSIRREMSSQ